MNDPLLLRNSGILSRSKQGSRELEKKKNKTANRGRMIILSNQGPHVTLNFIREGNPLCMSAAKQSRSAQNWALEHKLVQETWQGGCLCMCKWARWMRWASLWQVTARTLQHQQSVWIPNVVSSVIFSPSSATGISPTLLPYYRLCVSLRFSIQHIIHFSELLCHSPALSIFTQPLAPFYFTTLSVLSYIHISPYLEYCWANLRISVSSVCVTVAKYSDMRPANANVLLNVGWKTVGSVWKKISDCYWRSRVFTDIFKTSRDLSVLLVYLSVFHLFQSFGLILCIEINPMAHHWLNIAKWHFLA